MSRENIWKIQCEIIRSLDDLFALVQNEIPISDLPTKEDIDIGCDKVILQLLKAKNNIINYYDIK